MARDSKTLKLEGVIEEALPGLLFRVKLRDDEKKILAHLGGKLKLNRIRVIPGDKVIVEMTPYDENRGRIIRRL